MTDGEAGVSTDVDGAQLGWNTALGYRLGRHFAAEVGYLDAHVTEAYEAPPSFPRPAPDFIIDHTVAVTGPTLSVLGAVRPVPPFDVFLRVGVLFADREIRVHPGSPDTTLGDEVWLAGLGADWLIAPRQSLRLEYQRADELKETILTGANDLQQLSLNALLKL